MKACGVERQPPRLPTSMILAPGRTCARHARDTSSSTSTTSAAPSARTAFNVISSGSPGPAPTRTTFASRRMALCHLEAGLRAPLVRLLVVEELEHLGTLIHEARVVRKGETHARARQRDLQNLANVR